MSTPPTDYLETADIETASDDYASRFAGKTGQWLLDVQESVTLKAIADLPGASVLEVGGGHGQLTGALIDNGYRVTVHGSSEACRHRIASYADAGQCGYVVGDVLNLPFPDNAFDIVISYRFLAHVDRWQEFLAELGRVAAKAIVVDYPTVFSVNYLTPLLFKFKKNLEGNTRTYRCYNDFKLNQYLTSIDLQPVNRVPQFFLPMVVHRALKQPPVSSVMETVSRTVGLNYLLGSPVILRADKQASA